MGQRPSFVRLQGSPWRKARPAPVFGPLDQRGPQGISLGVTWYLIVVIVLLDGKRLESAMIDLPAADAVAMLLSPLDVRVGKPLHETGKIVITLRPEQKVPVWLGITQ